MDRWIASTTLRGCHAQLEPLGHEHREAITEAVSDGALWTLWYTSAPRPDAIGDWLAGAFSQRDQNGAMPFVVRRLADSRIVGATRMFNVDAANRRLEIGHTWYSKSAQRTAINTECKLMLLGHAFGELGCVAVELRTHFMNRQSRQAIERLGAKLDGVLRSHQVMPNGTLRDTCVYSIIASEWPAVQANLRWQLRPQRDPAAVPPEGQERHERRASASDAENQESQPC